MIGTCDEILISPISVFEIGLKVRAGKWPDMDELVDGLPRTIPQQGARVADLTPETCLLAANLAWAHRDPFDRLLAATAIACGARFVSADTAFDALQGHPGWTARIW